VSRDPSAVSFISCHSPPPPSSARPSSRPSAPCCGRGTGSGKTFCLIQRIASLIDKLHVSPNASAPSRSPTGAEEMRRAWAIRCGARRRSSGAARSTPCARTCCVIAAEAGLTGLRHRRRRLPAPPCSARWARAPQRQLLQLSAAPRPGLRADAGRTSSCSATTGARCTAATWWTSTTWSSWRATCSRSVRRRRTRSPGAGTTCWWTSSRTSTPSSTSCYAACRTARQHLRRRDDEQSIFSWTGADPRVLERFRTDYEVAAPIVLEKNHPHVAADLQRRPAVAAGKPLAVRQGPHGGRA